MPSPTKSKPAPVPAPDKPARIPTPTRAGYQRRAFLQALMGDAGARLDLDRAPRIGKLGNVKIGTQGARGLALVYAGLAFHDCPGKTAACRSFCYAQGVRYLDAAAHRTGACFLYSWLSRFDLPRLESIITAEIGARMYRARLLGVPVVVRVHEAGDYVSAEHAEMWRRIAEAHPAVIFYGYTRSDRVPAIRPALQALAALPNFHLRASFDPGQIPGTLQRSGLPAAIVSGTAYKHGTPKGAARIPGTVNCPEQATRGAISCVDCGLCWHPSRPAIRFWQH